jgi:DeoR/GlpR family transcriptional regulator of sugar metabolism
MLSSERHRRILMEIESRGNVTVHQLKSLLNVSLDTVRRDLDFLDREKKLKRIHGGAVAIEEAMTNQSYLKRKIAFIERKQELARYAADLVQENQAICLNAGTTNIEVAKQLASRFERLTIMTNSLKIAEILAGKRGYTVILPGGIVNHDEYSLYGRTVQDELAKFNIDVAFISINAISLEKGLTDFRQGESEVINAMIACAKKTVVVADSSKFETISYLNICGLDRIHAIVTDSKLNQDLRRQYEEKVRIIAEHA